MGAQSHSAAKGRRHCGSAPPVSHGRSAANCSDSTDMGEAEIPGLACKRAPPKPPRPTTFPPGWCTSTHKGQCTGRTKAWVFFFVYLKQNPPPPGGGEKVFSVFFFNRGGGGPPGGQRGGEKKRGGVRTITFNRATQGGTCAKYGRQIRGADACLRPGGGLREEIIFRGGAGGGGGPLGRSHSSPRSAPGRAPRRRGALPSWRPRGLPAPATFRAVFVGKVPRGLARDRPLISAGWEVGT